MAPHHSDSSSSDDEGAPESVSIAQLKQDIRKKDDSLEKIRAAARERKRVLNRERDRRLKEQAENRNKRQRRADVGDQELEARMTRAMEEADGEVDEGDEDSGDDDGGDNGYDGEEFLGINEDSESDEDANEDSGDSEHSKSDEGMDSDDEPEELVSHDEGRGEHTIQPKQKRHPNHLPDHLFTSASSSHATQSTKFSAKRKVSHEGQERRIRKRPRGNNSPKDVVVGSRIIRTLASDQGPSGAGTLPSSKVRKFVDRALAFKGGNAKTRGWERRPVNVGVMKRNGPAANFVRNR